MRTSGTKVTGRACYRDFGVVLGAIKAGRTTRATLLAGVRVIVPKQALLRAAGSVSAISSCIAHGTTDRIPWGRRHSTSGANVPSRALAELPVTLLRNTSTVTSGTKCGDVAHNARHQSVGRWSV